MCDILGRGWIMAGRGKKRNDRTAHRMRRRHTTHSGRQADRAMLDNARHNFNTSGIEGVAA
jgi:hypothetical protein